MTRTPAAAPRAVGPDLLRPPYFLARLELEEAAAVDLGAIGDGRPRWVLHSGRGDLEALVQLGGHCIELDPSASEAAIADALDAAGIDLTEAATLVDLRGTIAPPRDPSDAARTALLAVFRLARVLEGRAEGDLEIVGVTALDGGSGVSLARGSEASAAAFAGAFTGAYKAVLCEWREAGRRATIRLVDLPPGAGGAVIAQLNDLIAGPHEEIGIRGGSLQTAVLRRHSIPPDAGWLGRDSVVLMTGGGRGIGAEIAAELARRYACKLVLVGRSAAGNAAAELDFRGARRVARAELGPGATVHEVNAEAHRVQNEGTVAVTLNRLADLGAEVLYLQADIRDADDADRVLDAARERFGRIDVLIHGAGVERSRAMAEKEEAELAAVMAPKVAASHLFSAVPGAMCVALTSVSGRFGNSGQIDYCAANASLAKLALAAGGLAIDYSAWAEVGMAASLAEAMRARGVDALAPATAAGVTAALIAGKARGEWLLAGRLRNVGGDATLTGPLELQVPTSEVVYRSILALEDTPFLWDHRPTSAGVLPAVVALQAMIDAAHQVEPSLPVCGVTGLAIERGLKAFDGRPLHVRVTAERRWVRGRCLSVSAELRNGEHDDAAPSHSATVLLGAPRLDSVRLGLGRLAPGPDGREIYRTLFHGPSFRVLSCIELGEEGARGRSHPLGGVLGLGLPHRVRASTMARELVLQTAGVFLLQQMRVLALPVGFAALAIHAAARAEERVTAAVRHRTDASDGRIVFDAELCGEDGRLLERFEQVTFRPLAEL